MFDTNNAIGALYVFDVDANGHAKERDPDEYASWPVLETGYRWVHLDVGDERAFTWLEQHADTTVAESMTVPDARPRCTRHDNGILLNLRGVNLNPQSDPEDMVSIRFWVTERMVVTTRRRRLMAVSRMREQFDKGYAPMTTAVFVSQLASGLTERMTPVVDDLVDVADGMEDESLDSPAGLRPKIADLRRTTIMLRRYIAPQREALNHLATDGKTLFGEEDRISLRETVDRVTRLIEDMDAVRERCGILSDQLADSRAEEMNRNMMVLSIVAAIFLPLSFITGLLGVNIGGIPGTDNAWAFPLLCASMIALGVGITFYFKKLNWL